MKGNPSEVKQTRLNYLDFYKGICILTVVITHYEWETSQRKAMLFPFWVDMAVPYFLVITGYLSSMIFKKKNQSLKTVYSLREIIGKWMRFIVPFTVVFVFQTVAKYAVGQQVTAVGLIKAFVTGGDGPGSYYFPVMMQVVVFLPMMYYVICRYKIKGLISCFAFNILYEIIKTVIRMPVAIYRLCALRYIFILGYGCFLFVFNKRDNHWHKIWYYLAGGIGLAYLIIYKYTSAETIIIPREWTATSVIGVLFIVPITQFIMTPNRIHCNQIELLGKASFNIFLVQMVYYWGIAAGVYRFIPNIFLRLTANIIICCGLGIAFYKVENPITQRIIKKIRR